MRNGFVLFAMLLLLLGFPGLTSAASLRTWLTHLHGKTYRCAAYEKAKVCVLAHGKETVHGAHGLTQKTAAQGAHLLKPGEIHASWCVGNSCVQGEVIRQDAKETVVVFPAEQRLPPSEMRLLCWLEGIRPGVDGCP